MHLLSCVYFSLSLNVRYLFGNLQSVLEEIAYTLTKDVVERVGLIDVI